ncbi:MAG: RNA polymerase sigma factor [Polyangiaceae bacterium]|nr:RNA polymerase sigma factor [Polyangiaceae bacterium]
MNLNPAQSDSDEQIVHDLLAGNVQVFSTLVDTMHRPLMRIAEAVLGGSGSAEEVVQDTWVAVIEGLPKFEKRSTLRTWISKILVNQAKTRRMKERREVPAEVGSDDECAAGYEPAGFNVLGMWKESPHCLPGADDTLFSKEAFHLLRQEIEKLPASQRAVITLRDLEDWTSEEVCNVLGLSETNQRVLLHRGRQKLREVLIRRLGTEVAP